ncbi:hypothetical protein [Streptomyces sp. RKAG337]|uniref:hypothetical protein n=1 Tax=Streptomyces sp. RKAG337 TaxID=2893404 RepID=UPI002033CAF0|nr:hypothetical protein [Streptomyces sp. RKAG337]MCM2429711.1 hypothetical protein [Streptomyces sp. RKAG337]
MRAVGGLFGKGATEAEETAASDATEQAASKAETDAAGSRSETGGCPTHSFTGNTRVLMANAASAALFTTFSATHTATDKHDLSATAPVAAQVGTQPIAHLTTTFHHPFYDKTQAAFTDAKDLHPGDVLQTPTGTAQVTAVRLRHRFDLISQL